MADRTGSRLQGDSVDRHFPWPQQDFCQMFLQDFAQFIRDPNSKPSAVNSAPPHNYYLSHEIRQSLQSRITEYVAEYLDNHTHTRDMPVHYPMERYMAQKEDDPWVTPRVLAQKASQVPDFSTACPESPVLGSRDLIHRAARDASALNWPGTDLGVSVVETRSHSTYLEKKVESFNRVIKQGGVTDLNLAGPSSRSDVSRSGNGVENIDFKQRGSSSCYEGFMSPKPLEVKRRQNKLVMNSKGQSVSQAAPGYRRRAGPKALSSQCRPHKCPDCTERFQFEARLKSHQAVHSKQKYRCNNCGSEFGRYSSLKRHQNTLNACEKKKEARLRQTSSQGAVGTRPENQNYLGTDAATSMTSRSSCRGSDGVSTDNSPHDTRYPPRFLQGNNIIMSDHAPTSPRSHDQNYGYRNEHVLVPSYSQIPYIAPQVHQWGDMGPVTNGWEVENDASNNGCRGSEFDQYIEYENE